MLNALYCDDHSSPNFGRMDCRAIRHERYRYEFDSAATAGINRVHPVAVHIFVTNIVGFALLMLYIATTTSHSISDIWTVELFDANAIDTNSIPVATAGSNRVHSVTGRSVRCYFYHHLPLSYHARFFDRIDCVRHVPCIVYDGPRRSRCTFFFISMPYSWV